MQHNPSSTNESNSGVDTAVHVIVDGIPVTFCPIGFAENCFDLRSRGYGMQFNSITCWPRGTRRRLASGKDDAPCIMGMSRLCGHEPDEPSLCRYCGKATRPRVDTATPTKYCSRDCNVKWLAWNKLQRRLLLRSKGLTA